MKTLLACLLLSIPVGFCYGMLKHMICHLREKSRIEAAHFAAYDAHPVDPLTGKPWQGAAYQRYLLQRVDKVTRRIKWTIRA
jgi:hypothetical protein